MYQMIWSAAVILLAGSPQQAKVEPTYQAFRLNNPTNVSIACKVRWGDGNWKDYVLKPSEDHWFSYQCDVNGNAPRPEVEFDRTIGDGQWVSNGPFAVDVKVVNKANRDNGKPYSFGVLPGGTEVSLYED